MTDTAYSTRQQAGPDADRVSEAEFPRLADGYRRELFAHCYRMTGSVHDAEDLVQETYLRAWRSYARFEGRSSVRTWLYRIATNVCLTALDGKNRRPLPTGLGAPSSSPEAPLVERGEVSWLEPVPDALVTPPSADPESAAQARATIRLAFIAALQHLPARQRAVLILRDVLAWRAAEVAEALDTTTVAVNSALQRAHAQLERAGLTQDTVVEPTDPAQRALLDRYVTAFWEKDVATIVSMLTRDAVWEMPPYTAWYAGAETIGRLIDGTCPGGAHDMRLVPTTANGQPAFGLYMRDTCDAHGRPTGGDGSTYRPFHLQVLTLGPDGVRHVAAFFDERLFAAFGLPAQLDALSGRREEPTVAAPTLDERVGLLERAVDYTRVSLQHVGPADLGRPTPCRGWQLEALLRHMDDSLAALTDAAEVGRVELAPTDSDDLAAVLVERLRTRACSLLGAWLWHPGRTSVALERLSLPAPLVVAAGSLEVAVHGWDVAQACGVDRPLPSGLARELLAAAPELVPHGSRRGLFAAEVPITPYAHPSARLLGWLGRRPLVR